MAYNSQFQQPCTACGAGTNEMCDRCERPHCGSGACLFETGEVLTFPPNPKDEFPQASSRNEEICLECYLKERGEPPAILWYRTARQTYLHLGFDPLIKGKQIPAGDAHVWYQPPSAGKMLHLQWGEAKINLNTFEVVQLLNLLKAHEQVIRQQAQETGAILIAEDHRQTENAIRADLGISDYEEGY